MKNKTLIDCARLALAMVFILLLTACSATTSTKASEQPVAVTVEEPVEPWDGDGMDIPLDGSSLEASANRQAHRHSLSRAGCWEGAIVTGVSASSLAAGVRASMK